MDDYRFSIHIAHSIGHGGQADVYLVQRSDTRSWVVAKFLRDYWDPFQRRAFVEEAGRQIRCAGPGVVPVLGWNFDAPQPFILVPYMARGTLADSIDEAIRKGQVWTALAALQVVREITISLDHAHQRGVAHLDVKPENVLVGADGSHVLNDFGLAATVVLDRAWHVQGFRGTPAYAAPEQSRGVFTTKADIWAVGAILYELLTGVRYSECLARQAQFVRPSSIHDGNVNLDKLVATLLTASWQDRPSARSLVRLIDLEVLRVKVQQYRRLTAGGFPRQPQIASSMRW